MSCEFSEIDGRWVCGKCGHSLRLTARPPKRNCERDEKLPIGSSELPSLASQVIHFGKDMANWAMAGCPVNTQSEHDRRLAICKGCEKFLNGRCASCGCVCNWSSWLAGDTKQCPLGKW